jgi:hypothetical protein
MTPVPEPQTRRVYASETFAVFHVGEAAFLLSQDWPLLTVRQQSEKPAYYFELKARKDLQLFTRCLDEVRAIRERTLQTRRPPQGNPTGETHVPADRSK